MTALNVPSGQAVRPRSLIQGRPQERGHPDTLILNLRGMRRIQGSRPAAFSIV
jgi:hypothetical protein